MKTIRLLFSFLRSPGSGPPFGGCACQCCRRRLGAYYRWDDSLSAADLAEVERHVNACSSCREKWEEFRRNQDMIVEESLPHFSKERVMRKLLQETDSRTEEETRGWLSVFCPRLPSLWFAGVCLLLLALPVVARIGLEPIKDEPAEKHQERVDPLRPDRASPPGVLGESESNQVCPRTQRVDSTHAVHRLSATAERLVDLPEEDIGRTLLLAALPKNEEQLEEWVREEFPHVICLYNIHYADNL